MYKYPPVNFLNCKQAGSRGRSFFLRAIPSKRKRKLNEMQNGFLWAWKLKNYASELWRRYDRECTKNCARKRKTGLLELQHMWNWRKNRVSEPFGTGIFCTFSIHRADYAEIGLLCTAVGEFWFDYIENEYSKLDSKTGLKCERQRISGEFKIRLALAELNKRARKFDKKGG